ncbi:MAG: putative succinyl-diaminopimelate desuccinylase [Dehalococcoidia bacterium]|nr:putative succinyl-diaminopimelate desuccinylase [Bacillota bacterium]
MIPAEIIAKVLNVIDPDELIDLTRDLVKINSVWDPAAGTGEEAAAKLAAGWAEAQGFAVEMNQVAPGRPNAVISWAAGPGDRTLMFEDHTDVVTPGDVSAWRYDPFGAEIVGRRMYGRGTNDTKGNLAAMLVAMASLKRSGVELAGTIIGGVLCDEEGQMLGVQDFIKRGHADIVTGAIICEPQDGLLCISQKGSIRARYIITGRMSHGAMPLSGLNTAPAVARLIEGLDEMELKAIESTGRDQYLGWPSFTPTVIQAPIAGAPQLNVMPQKAQMLVDVRTVQIQSHPDIRDELTALAGNVENRVREHYKVYDRRLGVGRPYDLKVEVEFLADRPCTLTDVRDPIVLAADWATR